MYLYKFLLSITMNAPASPSHALSISQNVDQQLILLYFKHCPIIKPNHSCHSLLIQFYLSTGQVASSSTQAASKILIPTAMPAGAFRYFEQVVIIFIIRMKVGQSGKPKLQIVKSSHKHNYRTQENSPLEFREPNNKVTGSVEFSMPQVVKAADRNGFGITTRPIRSLRNSKEKVPEHKSTKIPIFGINFLKNSLAQHLDKEEILEYASGRKKKTMPATQRIETEKNYRFTEGSEEHFVVEKDRSAGKSKVKFRLAQKPKSLHKNEEIIELVGRSKKKQSPEHKSEATRKMISFPKGDKLKPDRDDEQQLKRNEKKLTPFEKQELAHYQVYYIGQRRIYTQSDFTDAEGDPKILLHDGIAYRYEIVGQLGRGSFGRVFKAYDHKKKELVALKVIKCQKKFQDQAKVEIAILQTALLKDPKFRSNIVRMKGSFVFRGHSCITFQILHKNLYQFLKEHQFAGFSHDLIRRFAIQILQALCFFKKHNIIHCDLKPENILLKQENKSGIRVIDVGSGCFQDKQIYTYIQSRFYRAPEIIFGIKYTPAIDMWSFGCILVELFTGFPIFPGQSENEQVLLFMEALGCPPVQMFEKAERRKKFFDDDLNCKIPQEKGKEKVFGSVSVDEIVGSSDKSFVHLIKRCFEWNPDKRITPEEALMHDWILKGLPEPIRQQHIQQIKQQFFE